MATSLATPCRHQFRLARLRVRSCQRTTLPERSKTECKTFTHIPVTQAHLDAGQLGTLRPGAVGFIIQTEKVVARVALDSLRALGEPVKAVHTGFAVTTVVLEEGQELAYCWCDHGITMMALCDAGRAAEIQAQTVMLMDLPTYDAYCADHPRS